MEEIRDYSIGLDIGTNSVGWAVIRDDYKIVKKRMRVFGDTDKDYIKKNLLGSLIFDQAERAQDRRLKRIQRRRYERRRYRIRELQKIFAEEINEVDPNFFQRLNESFLVPGEKQHSRHYIFGNYAKDKAYHEKYPTIYHLRKALADEKESKDLRLVYLALAHIIKFRGHFLIEGELNTKDISIKDNFKNFIEAYNDLPEIEDFIDIDEDVFEDVERILQEKLSRSVKRDQLKELLKVSRNAKFLNQLLTLIVGNQFKYTPLGGSEEHKLKFTNDDYDDALEKLLAELGDAYTDVFLCAKKVYNAIELADILDGADETTSAKLSSQMVRLYDEHKEQLGIYRKIVREDPELNYPATFHDKKKNGYAGYIHGKTKQEDFYKYVSGQLEKRPEGQEILTLIEKERFLRKQRSIYNGVIPNQVHGDELAAILDNQGKYYPFLAENSEKIKTLLRFRIPYYVGPLAKGQSEYAWIKRKGNGAITPWNFEDQVDLPASAEAFIENLTSYDTYLPDEKVLPKKSLLYQKFTIFNELTKISYKDERGHWQGLSSREKKDIFNGLFKKRARVTKKQLEKFIENNFGVDTTETKGVEEAFNSNYSTYLDLKKIRGMEEFLKDDAHEAMLEEIIKILTIFEDRDMRKRQLSKYVDILGEEITRELGKKHYTGWGRLSQKLIDGMVDKYTHKTILDYLIDDDDMPRHRNRNFMQLINDEDLSFKETIRQANQVDKTEQLKDIVAELPGSPAIKKGIHLSVRIVDEIIRVMRKKPKHIVIEMAREQQTTDQGKRLSKTRETKIKAGLNELGSNLLKEISLKDLDLRDPKVYLYLTQNGKDMYTEEAIDINRLRDYDIDHIIPKSFLYDNSADNTVLTKNIENRKKADDVPSHEIAQARRVFWHHLKECGLISQRKYDNLTKSLRGGLTEKDKVHFINRQLVETRQITKHVANILDQRMNPNREADGERETHVVLIKSAIASTFRKKFKLYKVREINDHHHAHDAYLNAIIALRILKNYPYMAKDFIYGEYRYTSQKSATHKKQKLDRLIEQIEKDWQEDIGLVMRVLSQKQVNVVKKTERNTGAFYDETRYAKSKSSNLIPLKEGLDTEKYGGYSSIEPSFYILASDELKNKKRKIAIDFVSIKDEVKYKKDPIKYLKNKGYINPKIHLVFDKYTLFVFKDGSRRMISGKNELQKANQLVLSNELNNLLYHLARFDAMRFPESYRYVMENKALIDHLFDEVTSFAERYIDVENNLKVIRECFEKFKNSDKKDLEDLANSMVALLTLVRSGAPSDFKFLDKKINRKRYAITGALLDAQIIFQSLTGLYETRKDLR